MQWVTTEVACLRAGLTGYQYLIVEPMGVALVDTGLPGSHRLILRRIAEAGRSIADLKSILITHADPDHCGALAALQEATNARVYASTQSAAAIRSGQMPRKLGQKTFEGKFFSAVTPIFRPKPAEVDQILRPGDRLEILGGLHVIDSAGHAPGHLSFFSESTGILFAGDSIEVYPRLAPYEGDTTLDPEIARASFERQIALRPWYILGGHGWTAVVNGHRR